MRVKIRAATEADVPEIVRISKQSPYTKGVTNPRVVSPDTIARGEMGVAATKQGLIAFVAVRHLVRKPWTTLHYIGVDERYRSQGIGERLVRWVMRNSPHGRIRLISEMSNPRSHGFYQRLGFELTGEGANRSGEPYYIFEATTQSLENTSK